MNAENKKNEIDAYRGQVVKAVENGTAVEHRGGPRPGSGRKPKAAEDRRVQLAISCTAKQKAAIVKTAADCGKTTSDFILWSCGVDDLE